MGKDAAAWAGGGAGSSWSCLYGPFPLVWLAQEWQGQGMAGARALSLHITRMKSHRTHGTLWAIAGAVSL